MAEILNCEKRDVNGTLRTRRMRQAGNIPAVLYGRGDNLQLSITNKDIKKAINVGNRVVELKGCVNESAFIKDIQWDPLGDDVLHLDLMRIDASELLDLTLEVNLVGDAPGTKTGGVVRRLLQTIDINCPAAQAPDNLVLKINGLELNMSLTAGDISIPEGANLVTGADEIVVQCVEPTETEDKAVEEGDALAEPEVIGRKSDDEDGGDE